MAAARLAEAYTCTGSCTSKLTDLGFSYSARGDVTGLLESTPNSGEYYSVGATYWANGLVNVLSGTGLPNITYTPNGEGQVYSMTDNLGNTLVSNTSYNVFELPTGLTLGSGDSDAYGYDSNTGRMTSYQFNVNGQSMVGNITWNTNGTLEQLAITDPFNSSDQQTCNYVYDDLARAASINCTLNPSGTANWSQAFSFDAFGNIDKTGSNGGTSFLPTYTSNPPTNRYASLPAGTPRYDANGNVLADGFHNYTWDADGNWATIDTGGITYDALDRIVEEGPHYQIVYGPDGSKLFEMNQQAVGLERAPMPGGGIALYRNLPPLGLSRYWHVNWQGSTPLATNPNRTIFMDGAFAPYGEPFAGNPYGDFTGQVNDTDNDLYDFLYREYQLTQGRWISPDPAGLAAVDPSDPQSWNRYAFALNNPCALIDPLGLDPTCAFNIAVNNSGIIDQSQLNTLEATLKGIFEQAGVGVNFNFPGEPDYTLNVTAAAGYFDPNIGPGAPPVTVSNALGATVPGANGWPGNVGFVEVGQMIGYYPDASNPQTLATLLGRAGAHEAGHFLVPVGGDHAGVPYGIMVAAPNLMDPSLGFTAGQAMWLQSRCNNLHKPAGSNGARSGGGGPGGPGGGGNYIFVVTGGVCAGAEGVGCTTLGYWYGPIYPMRK